MIDMGDEKATRKAESRTKVVSKVKGGWVKRDAASGRFVEVGSEKGIYRAKPDSEAVIEKASKDRHDVLKRLANR
jgi:hypothetical protein